MKAKDSVKNYDSKIREYTNYSYRQSKNACKNYGPRPAGSESEKDMRKHLVSELETCATEVKTESFRFAKATSFSENIFTLIFFVLATLLVILECFGVFPDDTFPAVSVAGLVIFGVANIFTGYTSKIFAVKSESENIFAVRNADGEAKKRLILLANSDSMTKQKFNTFPFVIVSTIGFVLAIVIMFLNTVFELFTKYPNLKFVSLALVAFIPFAVISLFADSKDSSDGASKNLSGAFASIAVLKYLKDNNIEMASTEICVLITSAHECDSSGAKAFMVAHSSDFSNLPTVCIGIDSIAFDEKNLGVIKSKNTNASFDFIKEGAEDAGVEINDSLLQGKYLPDSLMLSAGGIDSCTITSLPENYVKEPDTHEDMKVKTIESALKTVVSGLFIYDEK